MQRIVITIMLLLSACRLSEEPVQQAKGAFARGDVVFDAQDISKAAVMQCTNADCTTKQIVPSTLHQVELSGDPIAGVLQFEDLHISFQSGNKVYTCLRGSAPLGMMTPLWRSSDNKYCYEQAKDKAYVQQFAVACATERDWQLVAASGINDLEKFACEKDAVKISSECFVAGNTANCTASTWLKEIKDIYAKVGTAGVATVTELQTSKITKDMLLKDVKIMAEWKLTQEVTCDFEKEVKFEVSTTVRRKEITSDSLSTTPETETLNDLELGRARLDTCNTEFGADYFIPYGACINKNTSAVNSLGECESERDYIKITFEAK